MTGPISQDCEGCQFAFLLDENLTVVPGSGQRAVQTVAKGPLSRCWIEPRASDEAREKIRYNTCTIKHFSYRGSGMLARIGWSALWPGCSISRMSRLASHAATQMFF
ncbi:MAG: hypothetical protein QM706_00615 [Nitrospira sp.]